MNLSKIFSDLSIRSKLIASFVVLFIPAATLGNIVIYSQVRSAIETNIESELKNTTGAILNLVRTAAAVSIKNHLRAIAEKNREVIDLLYREYKSGKRMRDELDQVIRTILSSQKIGHTGYIYCVDSTGMMAVHPNADVEGSDQSHRTFVQEQIRKKEGYIEYFWKNPGDTQLRPKALYMTYFEPLDWIISVSTYREEFNELIDVEDFRDSVESLRFGKTGYSYVIDTSGNIILHPELEGRDVLSEPDSRAGFLTDMIEQRNGKIVYSWQNPGEKKPRKKRVIFNYIPEYKWIVASSYYEDEIFAPLYYVRNLILAAFLGVLLLVLSITVLISSSITRPLKGLMAKIDAGTGGDLTVRMSHRSDDELGQLAQYFNAFMNRLEQEIRERTRAEENLRESKAHLQTTFESLPLDLFCVDSTGRLELQNPQSISKWGNMIGKRLDQLPLPESIIRILENQKQRAFSGEIVKEEMVAPRDGEERFYSTIVSPVRDKDGIRGILRISMDITDRKKAENELLMEKEKFRLLLDRSPLGISLNRPNGKIEYLNPKFVEIFGYTLDDIYSSRELIARAFPEPAYRRAVVSACNAELKNEQGGEGQLLAFTVVCKDGAKKVVQFWPVTMEDGNHLFIYDDITDKHRLESRLRQAQKMEAIGTLAGGIAHDFNNILSAIMGYSELSLFDVETDSPLEDNLKNIMIAGKRAKNLIRQILAFSRHSEPELIVGKMTPVVSEALNLLRASLPATIEIQQELKSDSAVLADPTQIHQILINLCSNAAHSMAEQGGTLKVSLGDVDLDSNFTSRYPELVPGPYVILSVSDTGKGMDPATLDMIFDPFFTTKGRGEGTGMGLAVVHGIVKSHGGTITVYSEPGRGSTFNVFLPADQESGVETARLPEEMPTGSEHILFVDDEKFQVDIGRRILGRLGYRVTATCQSADALETFRSQPDDFDLVITDLIMPKMSGEALARELLSIRADIPIIMCTGYSEQLTEQKAGALGIKGFVMKPIVMKDIARLIRNVLDET